MAAEHWFEGAFWWNWNTDDGSFEGDDYLSPQWKPAEDVSSPFRFARTR